MSDTFSIIYHVPAEPLTPASVTAATITWCDQQFPVQVQRHPTGWLVSCTRLGAELVAATFPGALTTAHLNAYLYASDLVASLATSPRSAR